MVEEAAGTRMYETKRQAAQKTIEKKEAKLVELEKVKNYFIVPFDQIKMIQLFLDKSRRNCT